MGDSGVSVPTEEFEALYREERPGLLRRVARRLGSHSAAADIVQEVFLRLWEKSHKTFDNAPAYLGRSVNNAVIDHIRAERVRSNYAEGILPEQYASPVPTPLEIVEVNDIARQMDDAIMALPERTRHVFLLNRIHGRSFCEIAVALDISERIVARHMARAVAACENGLPSKNA